MFPSYASKLTITKMDSNPNSTQILILALTKMGIRVVGKGSWKKREVVKFQVGKSEGGKFLFKLERTTRS